MKRPINICSGQFGDLTLEELCKTMHEIGYNGIEIATQAHLDVRRVLKAGQIFGLGAVVDQNDIGKAVFQQAIDHGVQLFVRV